ncbi:FUSC family protein [Rubeoparvulum massiliense]|uniref:FUSC family protein n=1 Tax=Rubeoparvulum massiliense TaxID=1631346 RepID=UPI00065E594C|nr:aromatic acid exporter family protein [Rubeoparvulum massiliense]
MERLRQWIGGRLIKTGIAVFITSAILIAFDLPVVYAVMATIVSIEPTAAASLRKGLIRFPAAVLGAAFALTFDYLLGPIPLTYTLAAMVTIFVCHRLGWGDGLIVATLTAIVMIPSTTENYTVAFFTRMLTTFIGIGVATLVNLFIFPPRFMRLLCSQVPLFCQESITLFDEWIQYLLGDGGDEHQLHQQLQVGRDRLQQFNQFQAYQEEEWRYHQRQDDEHKRAIEIEEQVLRLKLLYDYLGVIQHLQTGQFYTTEEKNMILAYAKEIGSLFLAPSNQRGSMTHSRELTSSTALGQLVLMLYEKLLNMNRETLPPIQKE